MKNIIILAFVLFAGFSVSAQKYKVPDELEFAGMTLELKHGAREEIQKYVDQLTHNEKFQKRYVDLADIYFPVIEQVFKEENFPEDFKYLAIQESALNGEAVSTSNAVGYWQMKEASAKEVGLVINNTVDERKNIVSASRGAARYITKNNGKLKNWIYALNAYYLGPKGVLKEVKSKYIGADKMELTKNTHWYVLKFLAHKIAFEQEVRRNEPSIVLLVEKSESRKSLKDYAKKNNISEEDMEKYNPWIAYNKNIPDDRFYPVILPVPNKGQQLESITKPKIMVSNDKKDPEIKAVYFEKPKYNIRYVVNKVPAIVAKEEDNSATLAIKGDIKKKRFVKFNDIESFTEIKPGHTYYLKRKKNKALVAYHVVQYGETLWEISQMYAIKEKSILRKNRMDKTEALQPGRVLWLQKKRPKSEPVEIRKLLEPLKDKRDSVTSGGSLADKAKFLVEETKPAKEDPIINDAQKSLPEEAKDLPKSEDVIASEKEVADTVKEEVQDYEVEVEEQEVVQKEAQEKTYSSQTNLPEEDTETNEIIEEETEATTEEEITKETEVYEKPEKSETLIAPETIKTEQVQEKEELEEPEIIQEETEKLRPAKANEHLVELGETLYGISRMYDVPVDKLKKVNKLTSNSLSAGMILKIPSEEKEEDKKAKEKEVEETQTENPEHHIVAPGETLYSISRKYGITVEEIRDINSLSSNNLATGMVLKIPSAGSEVNTVQKKDTQDPVYHTVKPGETLYRISRKYGAMVEDLKKWNNLESNSISVGQKIRVK